MRKSSIEWFAEKTLSSLITQEKYNELLTKAKAMHYSEIKNSYKKGYEDRDFSYFDPVSYYDDEFEKKTK